MKRILLLAIPLFASACEVERLGGTEFKPTSGGLEYSAMAYAGVMRDDPDGEALRMRFLGQWLADNGMCLEGYRITDRRAVVISENVLGQMKRIFYTGACT